MNTCNALHYSEHFNSLMEGLFYYYLDIKIEEREAWK